MTLEERIKYDLDELENYFKFVSSSILSKLDGGYLNDNAHFNMVTDINGCLEFWLIKLCDSQRFKRQLKLSHKDIRGNNDLCAYNKYLEKVGGIDMATVHKAYCQLQDLRKVRNIIHSGAHTEDEKLGNISGIHLAGTLLTVSEEFVENSLSNAESYLIHVANA